MTEHDQEYSCGGNQFYFSLGIDNLIVTTFK